MVSRVPTYATNQKFIGLNGRNQANLIKYSYQNTTGYKGWSYDVYNRSVNRLISFENQVTMTDRFIETNNVTSTRMELSLNSVEKITSEVTSFRSLLRDFASQDLSNLTPDYTTTPPKTLTAEKQSAIKDIQNSAFNLMKSLETYLNIQADGRYIFSGGKTSTAPVKLPWKTLEEFQKVFDGNFTTFPTTSAANLSAYSTPEKVTGGVTLEGEKYTVTTGAGTGDLHFTNDATVHGSAATTGDITFEGNTIKANVPGVFGYIEPGDTITISGTGAPPAGNDGTYTVQKLGENGTSIVVEKTLNTQTITNGTGATVAIDTPVDDRYILSHITADNPGAFSDLKAGSVVTIAGTGVNDGTYYISSISNDGKTISILNKPPLQEEDVPAANAAELSQIPNIGYIDANNTIGYSIGQISGGPGTTGTLTFAGNTITAANNAAFGYAKPGQTIEITGTGAPPAGNDGVYYVKDVSADGKTVTVEQTLNAQTIANGTGATIDLMSAQHGFVADNVLCSANTSGTIYFDASRNQMVSTLKGAFSTIKAGDTLVLNGTTANNGIKQVKYVSDDGKTIIFEDDTPIVDEPAITDGTGVNLGITYPIGTTINLSNIDPRYDGYYTIVGVEDGGNRLVVSTDKFPPKGSPYTPPTGTATPQSIASSSYYQGDHLTEEHRVNENTVITSGVNAEDSAFEKVIRALGMLCSGNLVDTRNPMDPDSTTYGVDADRCNRIVNDALDLLDDALNHDYQNITEGKSDLHQLSYKLTINITSVATAIEQQTALSVFFQNNIDNIEKVNPLVAAAEFQNAYDSLEVSMAALSKMLGLSLLNYL